MERRCTVYREGICVKAERRDGGASEVLFPRGGTRFPKKALTGQNWDQGTRHRIGKTGALPNVGRVGGQDSAHGPEPRAAVGPPPSPCQSREGKTADQ